MNKSILVAAIVLLCATSLASALDAVDAVELDYGTVMYTDALGHVMFMLCMAYLLYSIQKHAVGGAKAWSILALAVGLLIVSAFGELVENFAAADLMDTIEDVCLMAGMVALAVALKNLAKVVA